MDLDRDKLIGDVAKKMNILISKDDPVFACVLLNEIVLGVMVDKAINRINPSINLSVTGIGNASKIIEKAVVRATKIWWILGIFCAVALLITFVLSIAIYKYPVIFLSQQDQKHLLHGKMIDSMWDKLDKKSQDTIRTLAKENQ